MSEAKPTPGPWTTYLNTMDDVVIRKMSASGHEECVIARKVNHRNARLIAAAPELLAALRGALQLIELVVPFDGDETRNIRAAISKATQ